MLPTNFGSLGQAVSDEKIFRNRPIRNKNCLFQPCLLTDQDGMSSLYRGHSIDASYQVSDHLAKRLTSQITLSNRCDNVTFSLLQRKNFTF